MQHLFAQNLKHWRKTRRISQMDLALDADVSTRHISFLETGRSTPSRAMALRLADALNVPRDQRNALLSATGFARIYQTKALNSPDLTQVSEAINWMISNHDPFPALVFDQLWHVVRANKTGTATLKAFGIGIGDSLLDALTAAGNGREIFENWPEVATHMIHRLRAESNNAGGIQKLDDVANMLADDPEVAAFEAPSPMPAVIPATYRFGNNRLSMFTTLAHFSTAEDIALADLRIELMFPADENSKQMLLAMA